MRTTILKTCSHSTLLNDANSIDLRVNKNLKYNMNLQGKIMFSQTTNHWHLRTQSSIARLSLVCCFTSILFLAGCNRSPETTSPSPAAEERVWTSIADDLEATTLPNRQKTNTAHLFHSIPVKDSGLDFADQWKPTEDYEFEIYNSLPGGGICVGDIDGDDLPDVFLTQANVGSQLYRNLGQLKFEDITETSGVSNTTTSQGAAFVDVDNDGDLDLMVCHAETANQLFINDGKGHFTEEAAQRGLDFVGNSVMMAFADYDGDGDLDGYLVTNRRDDKNVNVPEPTKDENGHWVVPKEALEFIDVIVSKDGKERIVRAAQYDHLFRNNGDGTFTDVSDEAGLTGNYWGLSAVWWDYNRDGHIDLYVSNDFYSPDQLYRNNGDGTFTDVAPEALPHTPWYSMGADAADINNDGWLDFMGSDMSGTNHYKQKASMGDMNTTAWFLVHPTPRQYMRNAMYLNTGTDRFIEMAQLAGIANTDWTWSLKFADFDEDGWIDLYVTNGMNRDWTNSDTRNASNAATSEAEKMKIWLASPQRRDANIAYRNSGSLHFDEVSQSWGLGDEKVSYGVALSDLDRDGDIDIITNNAEEAASVYRNDKTDSRRILVQLKGTENNRHGIGATIVVETDAGLQTRQITAAQGYMSSNETLVHFGLGTADSIKSLTVTWPSGKSQRYSDLATDHYYRITETSSSPTPTAQVVSSPWFEPLSDFAEIRHQETPFNDFNRQPLLPNQLSQLGPGMAWADIDADGDVDLFLGGASGQAGQIFMNEAGKLVPHETSALQLDADHEDMGALFFDFDGDKDLDLYVASGGVECVRDDPLLQDRLYVNDGQGNFEKANEEVLPRLTDSGSCVSASDFDRDGDQDLFVGGRVIPGEYPRAPKSRLLRNDGGTFQDVTQEIAADLLERGLVTASLWSDVDQDGWPDLLVAYEWGPVALFGNQSGKLIDRTSEAGLHERQGWYNSLAPCDLDRDGDMDFLVGNFGWNTKYHANSKKPALLYYGDFEENGNYRLVEAEYEDSTLFPVRGKSCSTNAMPFLGNKFTKFHDFAIASLDEIYTEPKLEKAQRFEINSLESGALINDGKGNFRFEPFPTLAQVAPVFGISTLDANNDGIADVILAQNFFGPQAETGRFDGGVSLLLLGAGDGTFRTVPAHESGIVIPGDATATTLVDLDNDGQAELFVASNDGPCYGFRQTQAHDSLTVTAATGHGLPIGTRVLVRYAGGQQELHEVSAGSGYLSQSDTTLRISRPDQIEAIDIIWPSGNQETIENLEELRKTRQLRLQPQATLETAAS